MEPGNAQLSMTVLMTPDMANFSGNVHGGTLLKYLDEVAYACASRYAGRYVVTLSVDQVIFREPIHVGELVTFLAKVNYTGNTSMEVGIKVVTENIRERSVRHTNSCFFTMVAVDDDRKPAQVPPLQPHTSEDKRRFIQAPSIRAAAMLTLENMAVLMLLATLGAWLWHNHGLREKALARVKQHCQKLELELLDENVAFQRFRLARDAQGRRRFARIYGFEFTVNGEQRHAGTITQFGAHSALIELAPYPFEIKTPPTTANVIEMSQWRQEHKRWRP